MSLNPPTIQDTDVLKKNPKIGSSRPELWGMGERLVPDAAANDPTESSKTIVRILERHYETATRYIQGQRVLDIACGTGYGTRMMKEAGAVSVVGVDLSPEAIEYAQERYNLSGIEFICANAEEFEYAGQFDVIVTYETIEHLQSPIKFLERLHRMLVPGGTLLLSLPLGETRHLDPYHIQVFSERGTYKLLAQAGFEVEAARCDDWVITLKDMSQWGELYPENQATLKDLLTTRRGLHLIWDLVRHQGKIPIPQLLVAAKCSPHPVKPVQRPAHLDG